MGEVCDGVWLYMCGGIGYVDGYKREGVMGAGCGCVGFVGCKGGCWGGTSHTLPPWKTGPTTRGSNNSRW